MKDDETGGTCGRFGGENKIKQVFGKRTLRK